MHKSVKNGQLKKRASYGRIEVYLPWEVLLCPEDIATYKIMKEK